MTPGATASAIGRSVVAATTLACAFTALLGWILAHHGDPLDWDLGLHTTAVTHRTAALIGVAAALSATAEVLAYAVAAIGGLLALQPQPWWVGLLASAAAVAAGQLLRFGLSVAVGRGRPR